MAKYEIQMLLSVPSVMVITENGAIPRTRTYTRLQTQNLDRRDQNTSTTEKETL